MIIVSFSDQHRAVLTGLVTARTTGAGCCDGTLTAACAGAGDELLSDSYDLTEIEDGFFFAVCWLPCFECLQLRCDAPCMSEVSLSAITSVITGAPAATQVEGKVRIAMPFEQDTVHTAPL